MKPGSPGPVEQPGSLIKPGLERTRRLLEALGAPDCAIPCVVQVAGTNGKGSTAAMLEAILRSNGRRTALFTSPPLEDDRECLRLDGRAVDARSLRHILRRVRAAVPAAVADPPTDFERLTAAAVLAAAESGVDVLILEAGMGGRLDATSAVARVDLSVITSIDLDHRDWLGSTLEAIAREKAGIIRPGVPVVTSASGAALAVILDHARRLGAPVRALGRDFAIDRVRPGLDGTRFDLVQQGTDPWPLMTGLLGAHQAVNGATAALAALALGSTRPRWSGAWPPPAGPVAASWCAGTRPYCWTGPTTRRGWRRCGRPSTNSFPTGRWWWSAACWPTRTLPVRRQPGGAVLAGCWPWPRPMPARWIRRRGRGVPVRGRGARGRRGRLAGGTGPRPCRSRRSARSGPLRLWVAVSRRAGPAVAAQPAAEPPVPSGRCSCVKAIVLEEFGDPEVLQLRDLPDPEPGPGEVLVRVAAAGVCYHDLLTRAGHIRHGLTLPVVPGHEVAGVVEAVGPGVTGLAAGDRVCTVQLATCGTCDACLSGNDHICRRQRMFGHGLAGGYAEFLVAPARSLVPVPEGVPLEQAALFGCGIGTSYRALTATSRLQAGETVLVTGAGGGTGLHTVQLARALGARVLAVTTSEGKVDRIARPGPTRSSWRPTAASMNRSGS